MALDVYVGSLTRYYSGAWENIAERTAPERRESDRVHPTVDVVEANEREAVRTSVLDWCGNLVRASGGRLPVPDWQEADDTPYFTGRSGWDGFGSLMLWAAYAEHPTLRRPASLPEEWDSDAALLRSNGKGIGSRFSQLVCNAELWLPSAFETTFDCADIAGRRIVIGSAVVLRRQLVDLNGITWRATRGAVAEWARSPISDQPPLDLSARYGFAVFLDLAERAVEHRLPMKLNY